MPEPAYESPQYAGQKGSYAGRQYGGPSQDYPDLARQYSPGTGGRRRRRGRAIWLVTAAVVVAAAAGGGAAYALHKDKPHTPAPPTAAAKTVPFGKLPGSVQALDRPSSSLPDGFTTETVQASDIGTAAGFTIDVPSGWVESQDRQRTYFKSLDGELWLEVDLTQHTYNDMAREARYIERQSISQGTFPGYKRHRLEAVPILGTNGAFWQFSFKPAGSLQLQADDLLFIDKTPAGQQSYALFFRAPRKGWGSKFLPMFEEMLHTFKTT